MLALANITNKAQTIKRFRIKILKILEKLFVKQASIKNSLNSLHALLSLGEISIWVLNVFRLAEVMTEN